LTQQKFKKSLTLGYLSDSMPIIEELMKTHPDLLILSEAGMILQDYVNAFVLMKEKGDSPDMANIFSDYQNCLLYALANRVCDIAATDH
jgi:hypothetical protein